MAISTTDVSCTSGCTTAESDALLKSICELCAAAKRIRDPNDPDGGFLKDWEGKVFVDFTKRNALRDELKKRFELQTKRKFSTLERGYGGLGAKTAEAAFRLSAQIQDKKITEYLKEFVIYCNNNDTFKQSAYEKYDFQHRAFANHQETIQKLLHKKTISNLSVQERIELDKAIEDIKKKAGSLEYDKKLTGKRYPARIESGLQKVDQLLAVAPDEIKLLSLKIHFLLGLKRPDEAFYISEDIYSRDKVNIHAATAHLSVLISLERLEEALAIAQELSQSHPNSFIVAMKTASILDRLGKHEDAITEHKRAISINGNDALTYVRIALIYFFKLKNYKESERFFKLASRLIPENEHIAFYCMASLSGQGKNKEAIAFAQEFVEKGIKGTKITYMDAMLKVEEGRYGEAINIINEKLEDPEFNLLESNEEKSLMYFVMGIALSEKFYNDKRNIHSYTYAKECYNESLKYNPERPQTYEYLADLSLITGEIEEAKEYLSKASYIHHSSNSYVNEWSLYIQASQRTKKEKKEGNYLLPLEWCGEIYADNIDCAIQLAYFYIDERNAKDATHWIDKAITLSANPSHIKFFAQEKADLHHRLGALLLKAIKYLKMEKKYAEEAIEQFDLCLAGLDKLQDMEKWLNAMCNKWIALYHLGKSNEDKGTLKNAILYVEDLISECPKIKYHKQRVFILDAYARLNADILGLEVSEDNLNRFIQSKTAFIEGIKFNDAYKGLYSQMIDTARTFMELGDQFLNIEINKGAIEYCEYILDKKNKNLDQEELISTNITYAEALVSLYMKSREEVDFEKAHSNLSSLMSQEFYSNNIKILTMSGDLYGVNGNENQDFEKIKRSLDAYNAALQLLNKKDDPDDYAYSLYQNGINLNTMGFVKSDSESLRLSVKSLKEALCYDYIKNNERSMYYAHQKCGRALLQLYHSSNDVNDLIEATKHFKNAVKLVTLEEHEINYVDSHYFLGDTLLQIGDHNEDDKSRKEAVKCYEKCLKANATHENPDFLDDIKNKITRIESIFEKH